MPRRNAAGNRESLPASVAGERPAPAAFIGTSTIMRRVYEVIESAAASRATVFITGESGTGKDVCAQTIHRLSSRADGPFVAINCAAIPAGLLESELFGHMKGAFTGAIDTRDGAVRRAQGGTLFLDEICDMDLAMQSKLLRFLQTLTYMRVGGRHEEQADVRIVCATNKSPQDEVAQGRFRHDLYYRLHVVPVAMPSLRGRSDDILDLADYYLHLTAAEEGKSFTGFTREARDFLLRHDWPGNVREMQNMIRSLAVLHDGPAVDLSMLRPAVAPRSTGLNAASLPPPPLWRVEKDAIEHAIRLCDGNIPRAAAMLEIAPSTIYRKIQGWENRQT